MEGQQRSITLQLTEDQYEYIRYCVDAKQYNNRGMALKSYYDKQDKKPWQTNPRITLPELQKINYQQLIQPITNESYPVPLDIEIHPLPVGSVIMKQ